MNHFEMFFILNDPEWFACAQQQKSMSSVHVIPTRFQNGEISIHLSENITQQDVVLLKRFSTNIHEDIFELLQCVDTLHRMGPRTITLLMPYYPYARQDHNPLNESQGARLLASILTDLGVQKILTLDIHAPEQLHKFPIEIVNLPTEHFWGNYLKSFGYNPSEIQIIAADKSAVSRAQQIGTALGCSWGYVNKQRDAHGAVQITETIGISSEKRIFLVDDLIDTGRTIIAAAQTLRQLTPYPIIACVTHCHLSQTLLPNLLSSGISQLITTNTIKCAMPSNNITRLNAFSMLWQL